MVILLALAAALPSWAEDGDYPLDLLTLDEQAILVKINQFRANPWAEAAKTGLDVDAIKEDTGDDRAALIEKGMEPLNPDEYLMTAASSHFDDMSARQYFSHVTPEGVTPEERIRNAGFPGFLTGESLSGLVFEVFIDSSLAAETVINAMFEDALRGTGEGSPLLDPELKEIGLRFSGARLEIEGKSYNLYMLVMDFGTRDSEIGMAIAGHVYQDLDGDGAYTPGEGVGGREVTIEGLWQRCLTSETTTRRNGQFVFHVCPFWTYRLQTQGQLTSAVIEFYRDSPLVQDIAVSMDN